MEEGIVPGGGVALLRTLPALEKLKLENSEEQTGVDIVKRAIQAPLRQLAANAGLEGSVVVEKVLAKEGAFGVNLETGKYEDLLKAGIIDPTKVTRFALQNAASIAGLLLTTEALVTDVPEKKEGGAGGGHMHGGGGMGGMGGMDM